jgi:hypothetical protein
MDGSVVQATSRLYAVLSVTGGKVGAASLWRKSVDEILSIGWASFHALRTTFPNDGMISYPALEPCTETKVQPLTWPLPDRSSQTWKMQ